MADSEVVQDQRSVLVVGEETPLSYTQQRFWVVHQLAPDSGAYNMPFVHRLRGRVDVPALRLALEQVVHRHASLRTFFPVSAGVPRQAVLVPEAIELPISDVSALPEEQREAALSSLVGAEVDRAFDLSVRPPWRVRVVRVADDDHILVLSAHHIIADPQAFSIMWRDLAAAYSGATLPALPLSYTQYSQQQRARLTPERLEKQLAYWKQKLADAPARTALPYRTTPSVPVPPREIRIPVEPSVLAGLRDLAQGTKSTLFMTCLAAVRAALARITGQSDLCIGVPISARDRPALNDVVGVFVNTIVLRETVSPEKSFRDLLRAERDTALAAYTRADVPFDMVVQALGIERSTLNPLFQVSYTHQQPATTPLVLGDASAEIYEPPRSAAQFDVEIETWEVGAAFEVRFTYKQELFEHWAIATMAEQLVTLLRGIVRDPDKAIARVPLLDANERSAILNEGTHVPIAETTLGAMFEAQVDKTPGATALVLGEHRLTYRALDERANAIAATLRDVGVGPEVVVGIALSRSFDLVATILGVTKAGGAWVPLDPKLPVDRLAHIVQQSRARAIVTSVAHRSSVEALSVTVIDIATAASRSAARVSTAALSGDNAAYLIFTSGSTGAPKGVVVHHTAVINELVASNPVLGPLVEGDTIFQLAPYTFDQSVHETIWPLVNGAAVVLIEEGEQREPAKLVARIRSAQVTHLEAVPTLWRALLDEPDLAACTSLRMLSAGGEALSLDLIRAVHAAFPGVPFLNGYGPTETAIAAGYWRTTADAAVPALSTAWSNVPFYALDAYLEPVPVGVAGELYLGGTQVARGYASRPGQTAERFVPDPFGPPGARMYRTGDRVRRLPDATLEFLGRVDDQVKLRGFRIELGEIEATLRAFPSITATAVRIIDAQLVAYYVAPEALDAADLRAYLAEHLPEYMVPAAYVALDAMPVTTSGKLDRNALPAPRESAFARAHMIEPRTDEERTIAAIWCEVLGVSSVGVNDNFFALGGHSLLSTQVIARIRSRLDVAIALRTMFETPTVEALAAEVVRLSRTSPVAVEAAPARDGALPLSYAQQRLWLVDRMLPGGNAYNIPSGKRIRGALDLEALRGAFEDIVRRHEILRTVFVAPDGLPHQQIRSADDWTLPLDDLTALSAVERHDRLHRISREDAERPFALATGPLLRTRVVRLTETEHVVLVTMHHIISDGWSFDVFWREVGALYEARRRGGASGLPALALQYADFALQQREALTPELLAGHLAYWKQRLAGAPDEIALPRRPRTSKASGQSDEVLVELDDQATRTLRDFSQRAGVTTFISLLAAFRAMLARTTGQDDIVIGTPIANRDRAELEGLIGLFVNTLALRGEVERTATFSDLVRRERETVLGAFTHQDAPFEMIVDELELDRRPGRSPVFQVWFVQETAGIRTSPIHRDVSDEPFMRGVSESKFDLSVYINEIGNRIELALVFNTDLFSRDVVDGIAHRFARAVEVGTGTPDRALSELDFGAAPAGADPRVPIEKPAYPSVLAVVEELATTEPDAAALRYADRTITRTELWSASSRIADALARAGVAPGQRVALAGPPSTGLIAAYLAILRSGACLVPLSSRLSRENADRLLALADARVVLQIPGPGARAHARVPSASIDPLTCAISMPASLAVPSRPADPAVKYIYFTSGTTGAQKGVIGNLVALGHFSAWQRSMFADAAGPVSAQLTELGFDVFLRDTMFALTAGKRMALPPGELSDIEPSELLRWMEREQVSAVHTVPSLARTWLRDCPPDVTLGALRCLFVVGEPLDAALVERWRARFNPDTEFINLYGTTETGPAKSWYRVPHPAEPGIQPVGWPLPETQILVMRDRQHLAAAGEVGEIVIRTPFSTLGYLDAARERESFYPNPFRTDPADILYRTGDVGRQNDAGAIEILGRADDQVKIRGQRVDPPGIAAALRTHPNVHDAAVLAIKLVDDDVRLVAYIARSEPPPSSAELREFLRQTLPPYMVPGSFVFLEAMPKKPNGKLDRSALPPPDWDADADLFVAPRGPEEEAIAAIWCEVLQRPTVSVRDDFFALGGHSLLAVLVTSRVRKMFDVELAIQRFFEAPTVEGMASEVVRSRSGSVPRVAVPAMTAIARSSELPLSFAQQRMWFLHRLAPESPAYNVPLSRRLRGALSDEALRRSFEEVVRRHESLRSVFPSRGGMPLQQIRPPQRWELPVDDLTSVPLADRMRAADRIAREEAERPFDLATGPLLRTRIVRLAPDDHLLLITLHHITSDGWSMGVLWTEISELYRAYTTGLAPRVPTLALQYADYAAWQRQWISGATLDAQLAYWTQKLADAPTETALPLKGPRPAVTASRGGMVSVELDADVVAAMRASAKKTGATQFVTLLAAFRAVLANMTGQTDLCIGTPIANRNRTEIEGLIGLFLNTLVLRTEVDPKAGFAQLVKSERATALEAYAHQDAPFEMVVDALEIERTLNTTPLFQVSFVHQNMPGSLVPIGDLADDTFVTDELTTRFDLSIVSFERDNKVVCELVYNTELFDRYQIEQLATQYARFLREALRDPNLPVGRISLLSDDERRRSIEQWNRTPGTAPATTLPAMFEAQVERSPNATALELGDARLSYRDLDARANRIAWALREKGVGPDVVVGIALPRSFELVAALLGVSKAGGAWVPMDPHLPAARLEYIASVANPRVVITPADIAGDVLARHPIEPPPRGALAEDNLAYVLFTSGSTGRPKGVMISHRGIVNELVSAQALRAQLDQSDAFLQLAPYTFDLSVHEILWPLTTGARLVLLPDGDHREPHKLLAAIRDHGVTIMHPVPTVLRALLAAGLDGTTQLRVMCSGGEAMPLDVLRAFTTRLPGVALINSYGPTETSVTVSQWRARPDATGVAIGLPWLATELHVLDARLEPAPLGAAGELYIGGRQVGRGYAGQPALTADRFVPDPFSTGSRLYRTGDRARRWPDGNIEIIGRVDGQVKLRGFRIELGEIEAVLREHTGVREAAVAIDGEGSDARLVAYIVGTGSAEELRALLATRLPEYMVPRLFVQLDAMPLNRSGKIDRGALVAPTGPAVPRDTHQPPRTQLEEIIAGIWSELLGVQRIGRDDNFFDIGGHSLLAARLAWEANVSISTVFAAPTIAQLAAAIAARDASAGTQPPSLTTVPRGGALALTYAQQRMWFLHQLAPASPAYHIAIGRRLRGPLDVEALRLAFEDLIARHEVLRTVFPAPNGVPHQEVRSAPGWELRVRDVSALPAEERTAAIERISREEREQPFDLARDVLLRTVVVRAAPDEHVVFATFHHIVADGWSIGIFWNDLEQLYSARVAHRAAELPHLPVQYADYAAWQRTWLHGDVLDEQLAYWKEKLAGAPEETALPLKGPRPALQTHHGGSFTLSLDGALLSELRALGSASGCTLFITLLAAFRALLARYSGQDDVCIGVPTANRNQREVEHLIGLFVNTLVLRTPTTGEPTFTELLSRERATALAAFAHAETPFEMIVEALGITRSLSRNPLFQVMFQVQFADGEPSTTAFRDLIDTSAERGSSSTHVDLDVSAVVRQDGGDLVFVYNTDLFAETTIASIGRHFHALLVAAVAAPETRLADLPLLSPPEANQLVHGWNATRRELPPQTLPAMLDARATAQPDAIAIAGPASSLTYAELVARSNRLAHHLRARGLAREERVALRLDRGPELVVAMLGVLKAGGAYLPIDSELPAERIAYMLDDAGVRITLTDEELAAIDPSTSSAPLPPPAAEQLAYVLYTSGSTGRPKGVHIQHGSLVNFLVSMLDAPGIDERATLLAVTTASFDISGLELYLPLLAGARVHIASKDQARDATQLQALLAQSGATIMQATPATWQMLVESGWHGAPGFVALCGGEALPPALATALTSRVGALWNMYGPTETTIWSARKRIIAGEPIRLGEPIANTALYILDSASLGVQPLEVAGELFIGGDGLARGYGSRPDLTAERFLPDPFSSLPGARMYRTGDRVRRRANGEIEFLGRIDHQVKLRGFRIELGEIEAVLADQPNVAEAVVVVRDEGGEPRLVAYVVTLGAAPSADKLLAAVGARVPDYMVPVAVVFLDELPLSPAGKIDRRALPAPDRSALVTAGYQPPRSPTEELLAEIWAELLGVPRVGVLDNFFELGGHSLLAMRVLAQIRRRFGTELSVRALFEAPTIEGLARTIAARPSHAPLVPPPRGEHPPLSFAQERMWFLHQLERTSSAYVLSDARRIEGLDPEAIRRAFEALVARHEILRTSFPVRDGRPYQQVHATGPFSLPIHDGRALDERRQTTLVEEIIADHDHIDLATGPLLRAALVRVADTAYVLVLTLHHMITDGWSQALLRRELWGFYDAFVAGRPAPALAPLSIQYADYATWQRSALAGVELERGLAFWTARLAGAPQETALPFSGPRPAHSANRAATITSRCDATVSSQMNALSRRAGASSFMTLLVTLRAMLARVTSQTDLVIGTPVANRSHHELEGLLGLFTNTLALRGQIDPDESFTALLARERDGVLAAFEHQDTPFDLVVNALRLPRRTDVSPLFQVWFVHQQFEQTDRSDSSSIDTADDGAAQFDLAIYTRQDGETIELAWQYNPELFEAETIDELVADYHALLAAIVAHPDARVIDLLTGNLSHADGSP